MSAEQLKRYPKWPTVDCTECKVEKKWRFMRQVTVWLHFQETSKDKDDEFYYNYFCALCSGKTWGIDEHAAQARIFESRPN